MRKHIPTWVEQLLENLPTIGQMCTAGDLAHSFSDKDILIASAGPSLVESCPRVSIRFVYRNIATGVLAYS